MCLVDSKMHPKLVPDLIAWLPHYTGDGRFYALNALARAGTPESVGTVLDWIEREPELRARALLPIYPLEYSRACPEQVFPRLLALTDGHPGESSALSALYAYVNDGCLTSAQLAECTPYVLRAAERFDERSRQPHPPHDTDQEAWIGELAKTIDILGRFPGAEALAFAQRTLAHPNPWPRLFAVRALLLKNGILSREVIEPLAACAQTRALLYRYLAEAGRVNQFPAKWATRSAFAESAMVDWLTYPTELATVPDEIEEMGRFPATTSEGEAEYFVYRFRTFEPHWAAKEGWMAGVAGPYLCDASLPPRGGGGTFSQFKSWGAMSAEEHLRAIVEPSG